MSNEPDKIIYSMIRVTKRHGQKEVLKDVSLSYFYGAKIGVLGLNGAGKSSLLRILAGVDQAFDGKTVLAPGYTIGYLEQEPLKDETRTVREVVEDGVSNLTAIAREFEEINAKFAEPMEADEMDALIARQAEVQELMDAKNVWDLDSRLEMAMDALRCPPGDMPVAQISGGERRRVALCRLLLESPDILLLDEPTNHLDAESVAWLERFLSTFPGTVIAVTHDRYFLDNVAGWILELDRGRGIPWKGNYSSWLEQKQKRLANEERTEADRQKTLQRELEWVRMSPKGRHAKGKARLNAYEAMLSHESEKRAPDLEIYIPPGQRLGKVVFELEGVSKGMGDRELMENVNAIIPPGAIVGIIGPNGAGKTTLFKMLVGQEKPDTGTLKVGETVQFAYVDQGRESLTPGKTVYEVISDGAETIKLGGREVNARAYCTRFNFHGADQQKKVDVLSGGERNRVHLACMLKSGANVLLLDEPTNDIDVNTMRALEDALDNFAGCVLVISHDRWFLDRVATHIMAFEGDSSVVFYEGNYTDYEEDRKKRLGKDADTPHRIKYRKLTR
ncbi:fused putative transporter subunits of ABC superfamily: ATP-binding components [uncultured Desulfovibrio sp.]|uniref:Energy-dependent translational throttle protein EttA n=1 Tax=uncultured Desulfovibrio sp. TaxID=167968 RepID=A0A212J1Z7_9BACT|nr:energy-dependent translational throttle protein EttA [Desulfovibrio desulfuricans]MCB6540746.1 energy-dependent translational throttle protein EttA [Desulfovibrio desulfuricans]MCB6551828.1 energy-dependent translational throttle protein EttA [Desulfovibrio desulfuricans]MCB6563670.1 energy-dependent translational throttle protein EttA [Desulfovibrio desulfuricans]MCB7344740.1 energy-dependent translational throttle protein EttA [Desulfovibrio desulfuricans]MCQ4860278.1 energy-dependent tra